MILNNFRLLNDKIRKSKIYWYFKYLFDKKFWKKNNLEKYEKRREFYPNFLKSINLKKIVFEFGCGYGENFKAIKSKIPDCYCFGYDISPFAIKRAKTNALNSDLSYSSFIKPKILKEFLNGLNCSEFTLSIYDRVLYNLSDDEVYKHFRDYASFFKYIIIDDFVHIGSSPYKEGSYESKNYSQILTQFNFELIKFENSLHIKNKKKDFFSEASKILIFKKNI